MGKNVKTDGCGTRKILGIPWNHLFSAIIVILALLILLLIPNEPNREMPPCDAFSGFCAKNCPVLNTTEYDYYSGTTAGCAPEEHCCIPHKNYLKRD